jgi:hypothetical protein
MTFE